MTRYKPLIAFLLFSWTCILVRGQDTVAKSGYQRFYYQTGILSSEGTMKEGKPDGYWKSYYENGTLKSEGNRKNFELDSVWRFYREDGTMFLEIFYRNGKKNGIKTTMLEKEILRETFVNDVKEGWTRYYLPDQTLRLEIPFVKGLEQGTGKEYDAAGNIITITEYKKGFITDRMKVKRRDKAGLKQGLWVSFHPNGRIREEGTYRNDRKNGYFKEYTENGDLIRVVKFVDDVLQPDAAEILKLQVQNEYYPDGKIRSVSMYRNGVPEGVRRVYAEDGTILSSVEYHNGIVIGEGIVLEDGSRDGPWKELYSDGSVRGTGTYDKGKRIGPWIFYHPDGSVEQTGTFTKTGKPDGTWKWFYPGGRLLREETYYNGLKDGLSEEFDESGILVEKGEYLEGKEDGFWITSTGDHCYRGTYRDGLRTGLWEGFYLATSEGKADSTLSFTGQFVEDLPDGKQVWYWPNGNVKEEGTFVMGTREGNWNLYNDDGTLYLIITYVNGVETRYDGVRIKPPFEKNE